VFFGSLILLGARILGIYPSDKSFRGRGRTTARIRILVWASDVAM